jgi:hypothetical protein
MGIPFVQDRNIQDIPTFTVDISNAFNIKRQLYG